MAQTYKVVSAESIIYRDALTALEAIVNQEMANGFNPVNGITISQGAPPNPKATDSFGRPFINYIAIQGLIKNE